MRSVLAVLAVLVLAVLVLAVLVLAAAPSAAQDATFVDLDGGVHEPAIATLAAQGVTDGCSEDRYCPDDALIRGEMAKLLADAFDVTPAETDYFTDDDGTFFERWINAIAADGISEGCDPDGQEFCPYGTVTRGEMASFVARAMQLSTADVDAFSDDETSVHEANIDAVAAQGIAAGCSASRFCPQQVVTRAETATFLARALRLVDRVPPPSPGPEVELTYTYAVRSEGNPTAIDQPTLELRAREALQDPRGWALDGRILFQPVAALRYADFVLYLTDDDEVGDKAPVCSDAFSCTVGDDLFLNDVNLAEATPAWELGLAEYQRYVVLHEVGHWLELDHDNAYDCSAAQPDAPVMMQQSIDLYGGCDSNVWPLPYERDDVAAIHLD